MKEVASGLSCLWRLQIIPFTRRGVCTHECQEARSPKLNTELPFSVQDSGSLNFPLSSVQRRPSRTRGFSVLFSAVPLHPDTLIGSGLLQSLMAGYPQTLLISRTLQSPPPESELPLPLWLCQPLFSHCFQLTHSPLRRGVSTWSSLGPSCPPSFYPNWVPQDQKSHIAFMKSSFTILTFTDCLVF